MYGIKHRGIGRYTECLISHLAKLDDDNRYTLFMLPEEINNLNLDTGKFKAVKADVRWYTLKEHLIMPKIIKQSGVDLMHWTHLNASYWCPVPYIVTIHDLIVFHFPDTRSSNLPKWKFKIKVKGYDMVLKNAINKARHIIAVSEFTKRDIMRHLSVDEQKISVTQLGIDKMLLGTNVLRNTPQFDQYLFDKFKIHKQYVVYVGSAYPHKNLEKLVNAFALTRLKYKRNWQLVLVGRIDEFYKRLQTYVNENVKGDNIKKDIIFTGQISDKELDGVYRGAKLLAYPSLYEGFGLPALEAASRGIPVVCASSSSLPEVMADAAYYFNPKDINHMASVLDLVGGSHKIQDEIAKKGLARSQQFSWQRTAQETLAVYNSLR
tara:strand:- start:3851 stop:4984 length:1134 start_codon:yes stop_codon:yes gene_type:complete